MIKFIALYFLICIPMFAHDLHLFKVFHQSKQLGLVSAVNSAEAARYMARTIHTDEESINLEVIYDKYPNIRYIYTVKVKSMLVFLPKLLERRVTEL